MNLIHAAVFVLSTAVIGLPTSIGDELRSWTDKSGKFNIRAELVSVTNSEVTIRDESGRAICVKLRQLSQPNRKYATEYLHNQTERRAQESFAALVQANQWLRKSEEEFFQSFPVEASIGDKLTVRRPSRELMAQAYKNSDREIKRHIGSIIASERSFNDERYRDQFAKLFREGSEQMRDGLIEAMLSGDDPLKSAARLTRDMNGEGLIHRAWRSERERSIARFETLKTVQRSMGSIVELIGSRLQRKTNTAAVKLQIGEESLIVSVKANSILVKPVLVLELEKESEDWSGIDALSAFSGLALGIDPKTIAEGQSLSKAQQQEMYSKQVAVAPLPSIPEAATCFVDVSAFNRHVVGVKSIRYRLLSNAGFQGGTLSLSQLHSQINKNAGKRSLFPLSRLDSRYSLHPPGDTQISIYAGALWTGKGRFVVGGFNAVRTAYDEYYSVKLRPNDVRLLIESVSGDQFFGIATVAGGTYKIEGTLDGAEVKILGLNPGKDIKVEGKNIWDHPYRGEWIGNLTGEKLTMKRKTPKGEERFSIRWKPSRKVVR